MRVHSSALILGFFFITALSLGGSTGADWAEDQSSCFLDRELEPIELGLPGSGKPQYVHQKWHLTEDCRVVPGVREESIQ